MARSSGKGHASHRKGNNRKERIQRYALTVADEPITDVAGYLSCGCHASQREHSCGDGTPEYRDEL